MRSGEIDGAAAAIELRYARAECLWKLALEQNPDLRGIGLERRHDLVDTFGALERQQFKDNVTTILANHLAQVPQGAMGEMKVLRGEIGKRRDFLTQFAQSRLASLRRARPGGSLPFHQTLQMELELVVQFTFDMFAFE